MKASTKRLLALLSSAALIFCSLIVYVVLLKPEYNSIQELRGELKSSKDLYTAQAEAIDYANNLYGKNQADINQVQEDLKLALPDKQEVASVIDQIQAISALNNIAIDSINLDNLPIQQKSTNSLIKNYGILRVSLKLIGTYDAFKELLRFLENNIRLMDARTLRIYQANNLEKGVFNYEVVVDTYYQVK
jgi:Tfp pilus assembly protein PilO